MTCPPDLELTLPARPENVGVVRHVLGGVAEALALDAELLDDLRLAVSEACANAVVHAYPDEAGLMDVDLYAGSAELLVSVRDHGGGMAPRTDSPGLGVGLALMAALAGSMELVTPPGGGTEVRMRFPRVAAAPATSECAREHRQAGRVRQSPTAPASHGRGPRR